MSLAKTPDELSELAWGYVNEALTNGSMTITGQNGVKIHDLSVDQMMDIVKWMTAVKIKQKHAVDTPEDFSPANTKGDDNDC